MERVKVFFAGQGKHAALANNQQNGYGSPFGGRAMSAANGANRAADNKLSHNYDMNRKDSDNYFYIMWRS